MSHLPFREYGQLTDMALRLSFIRPHSQRENGIGPQQSVQPSLHLKPGIFLYNRLCAFAILFACICLLPFVSSLPLPTAFRPSCQTHSFGLTFLLSASAVPFPVALSACFWATAYPPLAGTVTASELYLYSSAFSINLPTYQVAGANILRFKPPLTP